MKRSRKEQVEEAYNLIAAAKGPLQNVATDPSTAMAWGVIADASANSREPPKPFVIPDSSRGCTAFATR